MPLTVDDLLSGLPTDSEQQPEGQNFGPAGKRLTVEDLLGSDTATEGTAPTTSTAGAVLRQAGENVGPTAAAAAAFGPSAELGLVAGPIGGLVTGAVGAGLAAAGTAWVQHKAAQVIAPELTNKLDKLDQADEQQHPVAAAVGRLAAALPTFELNPGASVRGVGALWKAAKGVALTATEKEAATATAAQVGLGVGQSAIQPLLFGQSPTKQGLAEAFVQSLLLGHPRYDIFGKQAEHQIAQEAKQEQEAATKNPVERANADVYSAPPPPSLTPQEQAQLSILAAKAANGAPLTVDDTAVHAKLLTGDNEAARQYFNNEKTKWANEKVALLAQAAQQRSGILEQPNESSPSASTAAPATEEAVPATAPTPETVPPPASALAGESAPVAENNAASIEENPVRQAATSMTQPQFEQWSKDQGLDYGGVSPGLMWASHQAISQPEVEAAKNAPAADESTESVRGQSGGTPVADQLAQEAKKVDTAPTEAQKEAGNYQKGHVTLDGMDVTIENPAGSVREGADANGKPWSVKMPGDYGYIKGTKGADGDHVDVTIGPNPDGFQKVWIIDQKKPDGSFDEHKALLGYDTKDQALQAYRDSFSDGKADQRIGGITEMSRQQFKAWVNEGNTNSPLVQAKIADWMQHHGDADQLLDLVENSTAPVVEKGNGEATAGMKTAQLYREIKPEENPKSENVKGALFKSANADKNSRLASKKRVVMLSPDGSHVTVSTPGEVQRTSAGGKKAFVDSVATYDAASGKVVNRPYEELVNDGWKPLASIKTDETAKSKVETYSSQEWNDIRSRILETVQSKLGEAESGLPEAPESASVDVTGAEEGQKGSVVSTPAPKVFQPEAMPKTVELARPDVEHLVKALGEPKWSSPEEMVDHVNSALSRMPAEAIQRILDKLSPKDANSNDRDYLTGLKILQQHIDHVYEKYEHGVSPEALATALEKVTGVSRNARVEGEVHGVIAEAGAAGAGSPDAGAGPAATGDQQGAGRVGTGAEENTGGEQSNAATAAAHAEPPADEHAGSVKAELADKDGLGPKEYGKLQAIAERAAEAQGHEGRDAIEAAADEILDNSIAVKVNGEPGLIIDGQIHDQAGHVYPVPQDLIDRGAKFRAKQAKEEIARLRPTSAKTAQIAHSIERNLEAMGIKVRRVVDVLAKHFSSGEYKELTNGRGNTERIITWTLADAHDPSSDNLTSLLHEVFHAVFARETPEMQAAAQRAVEGVSNEILGIGEFKEAVAKGVSPEASAGIEQEGRMAESLARKLVNEGFDPTTAGGFIQRAFRLIRDIYNGTLMAFQKVAGYPVSRERTMAYFENRLKMVAAGDTMSFLNFLGGPKMKLPDWSRTDTVKYAGINPVTNPRKYLETKEGAPIGIAALNHFRDTGIQMLREWDQTHNFEGIPDSEIAKNFIHLPEEVGGSEMFTGNATPSSLIDAAAKLHGISPDTKIENLPNNVAKQRALAVAHRMLAEWKAVQDGVALDARHDQNRAALDLQRSNDRLVRLQKDYVDVDYMTKEARDTMLDQIGDVRTAVRGIRDFSARKGELEQVLEDLGDPGDNTDRPYEKALDGVAKILREDQESFSETLRKVAALDINWNTKTSALAEGLRDLFNSGGHDFLRPFFEAKKDSRRLLATLITYGKSNSHMMDLLAAREAGAQAELDKVNTTLKGMLNMSAGGLDQIRQQISKTFSNLRARDRMMRIADKIASIKRDNNSLMKAIEYNKQRVDFHEDVFNPIIEPAMAQIEHQVGFQLKNFEVYHGAELPVPTKPDATPAEFSTARLSLRTDIGKKGDKPTPTPQVVEWMNRMQSWLDHADNQRYGATYNEVADVMAKLRNHYVTDTHENLKASWATKFLGPLQEKCNQAGTTAARAAGQGFNRYSSLLRAKVREVTQRGTTFAAALNNARRECGYPAASEKVFWNNVIAPALHDLEQNGERFWALANNDHEMVENAIEHALDFMQLNSAKSRSAVASLLRLHVANSDMLVRNGAELGLKVLDKYGVKGTQQVYRPVIGKAPFTLPRTLTAVAQDFFREHMGAWTGDALRPDKVAAAYKENPDALRKALQDRFTPEVWDWFVKSLANNDKPHFYAPSKNDLKPLADRQSIINAYETSNDPVTFAENLSRLHGQSPSPEFVADTIDTVQQFANLLRTMVGDEAETIRDGNPAPARFIVDARHIEAAPKEWLDYLQTDQYNMERVIHSQAAQAAFGRNGQAMDKNLAQAIADQKEMATKYEAWRQSILSENPGLSERALQSLLKEKAKMEGLEYNQLKEARSNLATLNGVSQSYKALQGMNNAGKIPELMPWARLIRAIGGWTVSGAGTAITAHSVFLEQPVRLFGLSGRALAMTARSVGDLAKVMANSMLQAVGRECAFEADRMLAANEAGLFDPINTNRERMITAWNHAYAAYKESGPIGQWVGKAADMAGAALQTDVFAPGARAKALERQATGRPIAPTLKVLSPFHWMAESLQISNFITWQRHIEGLVASGARHMALHPELADDPNFKVTRDMLGDFGAGDREFRFLQQRMADFGFSLEQLVRDAYKNQGSDKPILSDEVNKALQQLTLNEITLESSLTSRMPGLQTSGIGVAMNPFLGWPLQKTYQVLRQLREPNGAATAKALRTGLTAYMAILPIGMAVAWLRNKFDEDVLGRKQNISDLGNIHDVKSGLMTALDNASRVGTFGFLGEGANYFFNDDNVRPLTVDNRVFFINTIENLYNVARSLYHQTAPQIAAGNLAGAEKTATDYQSVIRPVFQSLGGNGLLQNLGAINHLLGVDDAEARVSNRISVNNYLRVAGRELDLDVRTFDGMMQNQSIPNPVKPFVGQMVLAAYANDHAAFSSARRDAIAQAKSEEVLDPITKKMRPLTQEEAMRKVASLYEGQNPMRIVFRSPPTEAEYQTILSRLPDNGKAAVKQAIALYQHYGEQIGAHTSVFGRDRSVSRDPMMRDDVMSGVLNRLRGNGNMTF